METEHWITAIDKSFQRIIRWVYPGILFFGLLYLSDYDAFHELSINLGFPKQNIWGILLGSFVIGAALYLVQQYLINVSISIVVFILAKIEKLRNLVCSINMWFFLEGAKKMKARYETKDKLNGYIDYNWGIYHALSLTGYLILAFEFIDNSKSIFGQVPWLSVLVASIVILFAFILNARTRLYEYYFFLNSIESIDRKSGREVK